MNSEKNFQMAFGLIPNMKMLIFSLGVGMSQMSNFEMSHLLDNFSAIVSLIAF